MKKIGLSLTLLFTSLWLFAQTTSKVETNTNYDSYLHGNWYFGFNIGGSMSKIGNIRNTIISPNFTVEKYYTNDDIKMKDTLRNISEFKNNFTGDVVFYYRFKNSKIALQPGLSYQVISNNFKYCDVENLRYDMDFRYDMLSAHLLLKAYPLNLKKAKFLNQLHFLIGPDFGLNLTKSNISYHEELNADSSCMEFTDPENFFNQFFSKNEPLVNENTQIEENLKDVLVGNSNLSLVLGLGYEHYFGKKGKNLGLNLDFRTNLGLTDMIGIEPNGFGFSEELNRSSSYSLRIGVLIPVKNNQPNNN